MQIPCISCQSRFRLDSSLIKSNGSLVRCSKCGYIFLVYPPAYADVPVVIDTKIDQSILGEIFHMEQIKIYQGSLDQTSDEINNKRVDEIISLRGFEEEDEKDQDREIEGIELSGLPDLSKYEDMIVWDESPDEGDLTKHEKQFYNGTKDLDIDKA